MDAAASTNRASVASTDDLPDSSGRESVDTPIVPFEEAAVTQTRSEGAESVSSNDCAGAPGSVPLPPPITHHLIPNHHVPPLSKRIRVHSSLRKFVMLVKPTDTLAAFKAAVEFEYCRLYGKLSEGGTATFRVLAMHTVQDVKSAAETSAASEGDLTFPNNLLSVPDDNALILPILASHRADVVVITVEQCDSVEAGARPAVGAQAAPTGVATCARTEPAPKKQRVSTAYTQCWLGEGTVGREASWVSGVGQPPVCIPLSASASGDSLPSFGHRDGDVRVTDIVPSLLPALWVGSRPQFVLGAGSTPADTSVSTTSSTFAHESAISSVTASASMTVSQGDSGGSQPPQPSDESSPWSRLLSVAHAVAVSCDEHSLQQLQDAIQAYFTDHPHASALALWLVKLITSLAGSSELASATAIPVPDTMAPFVNIAHRMNATIGSREARAMLAISAHFAELRTQLASTALDAELRFLNETEDGDDVVMWLHATYPGDPFGAVKRLASAYLSDLKVDVDPIWLSKQHENVFKSNVGPDAAEAWKIGVIAAILAELGVISDALPLLT